MTERDTLFLAGRLWGARVETNAIRETLIGVNTPEARQAKAHLKEAFDALSKAEDAILKPFQPTPGKPPGPTIPNTPPKPRR